MNSDSVSTRFFLWPGRKINGHPLHCTSVTLKIRVLKPFPCAAMNYSNPACAHHVVRVVKGDTLNFVVVVVYFVVIVLITAQI